MENAAHYLKQLEQVSHRLGQGLSQNGFDGYMASALYVASMDVKNTVFALTHASGGAEHFQRTDKYVHLRRFSPEQSIAAEAFQDSVASISKSRMFPQEHLCVNIPITPKGQHGNLYSKGLLQVVFDAKADVPHNKLKSHIEQQSMFKALPGVMKPLLDNVDTERDSFFRVRNPYDANAVVMFFDISGFTQHSKDLGYYRAQDFADKFCQDFMKSISEEYGAHLLRYEGDGLWLEMPIDDFASPAARKQIIEQAINMAEHVGIEFPDFAKDQDYGFEGAKVKAVLELGEVRDYYWDRNNNLSEKPNDRSGPVFSNIRHAAKNLSDRNEHDILIGPELIAILRDDNIYNIVPNNFHHYCPNDLA